MKARITVESQDPVDAVCEQLGTSTQIFEALIDILAENVPNIQIYLEGERQPKGLLFVHDEES